MRLRKALAALIATLSITGVLAGPAFAGKPFHDGDGSCADLSNAGAGVLSDTSSAPWTAAGASADIATAPCRKGSYVFTVYRADGTLVTASDAPTATPDGAGTTLRWFVAFDSPQPDSYLCVTIQSLDMKGNLVDDAAPDQADPACTVGTSVSGPPAGSWH